MNIKMISRRLFVPGLLLLAFILASCGGTAAPAAGLTSCSGHFEVNGLIKTEDSVEKGTLLAGDLQLDVNETGAASGMYTDGELIVTVVGQVTGQAISLVFDLGDGMYMFGTGAMTHPIDECQGVAGGPVVGPETVVDPEAETSSKLNYTTKLALAPLRQEVITCGACFPFNDDWIWTPGR